MRNGLRFAYAPLILFVLNSISFSQSDWTLRSPLPSANHLDSVTWSNGRFVANFGGVYFSSLDGNAWAQLSKNPDSGLEPDSISKFTSILKMNGQYVALNNKGDVVASTDSLQWTTLRSHSTNLLRSLTWTGSQLVAVGNNGTLLTSPDGKVWTDHNPGTSTNLVFVHWTGSNIAIVDEYSTILTSPDGITWGSKASDSVCTISFFSGSANFFVWTGSRFVGFCNDGIIQSTSDFNTWTSKRLLQLETLPHYIGKHPKNLVMDSVSFRPYFKEKEAEHETEKIQFDPDRRHPA